MTSNSYWYTRIYTLSKSPVSLEVLSKTSYSAKLNYILSRTILNRNNYYQAYTRGTVAEKLEKEID